MNNILKLVAWGTRLSLALYEFGTSTPTATNDVSKLAKEVNLLAFELRQLAISLENDRKLPSSDANRTVSEILAQSQAVFQEIETIVPVKAARNERSTIMDGSDTIVPNRRWEWNRNTKLKADYLLGHLDGLKLTLSVLSQCLYVAKITIWSRKQRNQMARKAVDTERKQFQSLIVDQQMALIRVNKLYREYSLSKSPFLELLPVPNHQQALTQYDEREVNPLALVPYQEPSLLQARPAHTETEDLTRVLRVAQPYVDMLLHRWTRLEEMETRSIEGSGSRRSSTRSDYGRWENPTVESDPEEDYEMIRDPNRRLNGPGPVLMSVHEDDDLNVEGGLPASPGINVHRTSIPHYWSSPSSSPPVSTNTYFPPSQAPTGANAASQSRHRSPCPSPFSSPRPSISGEQYKPRPPPPSSSSSSVPGAAAPGPLPSTSPPRQEVPYPQNIPWRLRLNSTYWDHNGPTIINSNTRSSHAPALNDRNTVTEILATYVAREALEEAALQYRSVKRDSFDGRRTRFDPYFIIQRPMGWEEVRRLIARSDTLRRKEGGEQRRRGKGEGPLYVQQPPPPPSEPRLDRRKSLPAGFGVELNPAVAAATGGGATPQQRHGGRAKLSPRSSAENTSEDGEETKRPPIRRASSSSRSTKKERRKSSSGKDTATLGAGVTGVAASTGFAALLSDLAEGLSGF